MREVQSPVLGAISLQVTLSHTGRRCSPVKQHMVSENGELAVVIAMKLPAKHCLTLLTALKQNT